MGDLIGRHCRLPVRRSSWAQDWSMEEWLIEEQEVTLQEGRSEVTNNNED